MSSSNVLSINPKPLEPKLPKPKLVWPGYRELLNLDKQKTQKIESDDENEDYLQKLLKKEKEQKEKEEEQARLHRDEFEKQRREQERNAKILRRIERKRMIEDGLIDPDDLPEEPESEESVEEDHHEVLRPTEPEVVVVEEKQETLKSVPSIQRAKTTSHGRRCLVAKPVRWFQQPTIVTNAIYKTQRRALPAQYNSYLKELRTHRTQSQPRQSSARQPLPSHRKPNPQRIFQLSKPKSALSSARKQADLAQLEWDAFMSTQKLQKAPTSKFDFNFVTTKSTTRQPSPRHKQHNQHHHSHHHSQQKFSLSQLFLRKMFVKGGDQKLFLQQLGRKRRLM